MACREMPKRHEYIMWLYFFGLKCEQHNRIVGAYGIVAEHFGNL